ncbi:PiggyBac transposable element-derived protein [Trinorchestia longiramus]|nr:PiggyBac transposable element-derived protein [Trinorchestia longiramus]
MPPVKAVSQMPSGIGLSLEKIRDALDNDIPSDYDDSTDESEEETELRPSSLETIQQDLTMMLDDIAVIIVGDQSIEIQPEEATEAEPDEGAADSARRWKKKPEPAIDTAFTPLPQKKLNCSKPVDYFFKFIDEDILDKIHFESNLKSVQKNKPAHITKDEIKVFLGVNMLMGYHSLPSIQHYCSSSADLGVVPIQNAMTRDRYQTILSNLHCNDNSKMDTSNRDKLFKVRPLLQHLNKVFNENRSLSEYLCIDESTIRFKGRSTLKQYNPMKPIKRGYKLWCLADDSGYTFKTNVYTGKSETSENSAQRKLLGLGGEVVKSLLSDVTEKNHKVFFDNYFSSIPLMEVLRSEHILACGTIRSSRKDFPQLCGDKSLKRGDFDYRSTPSGITVFKWHDSKPVHLISNYHDVENSTVQRKNKKGIKLTVTCPSVVTDYNRHMGGVDKHDMMKQLYGSDRKSKKWWHRLFFGLLVEVKPLFLYSFM